MKDTEGPEIRPPRRERWQFAGRRPIDHVVLGVDLGDLGDYYRWARADDDGEFPMYYALPVEQFWGRPR